MRRGEVWLINLDPAIGAEIKKTRPAVIVNDDSMGILPLAWKTFWYSDSRDNESTGNCALYRIMK
jgi:hypothetical protein